MKPIRLQRWWHDVPVTILTPGVKRVAGTNTISDKYGDADLVWDPGFKLEPQTGVMHCVMHKRDKRVYTIETGCKCGQYVVDNPEVIHHFVKRLDAMVEVAVKMGSNRIYCARIDELNDDLVEKIRELGIQLIAPDAGDQDGDAV